MDKNDKFHYMMHTLWPKTRAELEIALAKTKKLVQKGEAQIKVASEKSAKNLKLLSINLKKEKEYYKLGRLVAETPKSKWSSNKKISSLLEKLKKLDAEIKKIK